MMPSRAMLVLQLAMSFFCGMRLDAVSIVKILYTPNDLSADGSAKRLEIGKLELHLEGKALIDYHQSDVGGGKQVARFTVGNVKLSNESYRAIENLHQNKGLAYNLTLTVNGTDGQDTLVAEFMYDSKQVNVDYAVGDLINGNGLLLITLQNKNVLRALDTNHESILRLAHENYYNGFYSCC